MVVRTHLNVTLYLQWLSCNSLPYCWPASLRSSMCIGETWFTYVLFVTCAVDRSSLNKSKRFHPGALFGGRGKGGSVVTPPPAGRVQGAAKWAVKKYFFFEGGHPIPLCIINYLLC